MSQNNSSSKYLDIVESIRDMIRVDGLLPGDRLPSERELSERLEVGRSSVREALRALELLGLIETRRGEGTFIKDFQEHKLVELLGTFFLQNDKVIKDLVETKLFIEIDCLRLMISYCSDEELERFAIWAETHDFSDEEFFLKVATGIHNRLLERIWRIVTSYANASTYKISKPSKDVYLELVRTIQSRDEDKAIDLYTKDIRNMSNSD